MTLETKVTFAIKQCKYSTRWHSWIKKNRPIWSYSLQLWCKKVRFYIFRPVSTPPPTIPPPQVMKWQQIRAELLIMCRRHYWGKKMDVKFLVSLVSENRRTHIQFVSAPIYWSSHGFTYQHPLAILKSWKVCAFGETFFFFNKAFQ